jgi:hypothetical protein
MITKAPDMSQIVCPVKFKRHRKDQSVDLSFSRDRAIVPPVFPPVANDLSPVFRILEDEPGSNVCEDFSTLPSFLFNMFWERLFNCITSLSRRISIEPSGNCEYKCFVRKKQNTIHTIGSLYCAVHRFPKDSLCIFNTQGVPEV